MEFLKAEFTEVWISAAVAPLVQFADSVRRISSTQLDLVGLGDLTFPTALAARLLEFDEVVSWYGSNRPDFRAALSAVHSNCTFLQALPDNEWHQPASDFFLSQVGGPSGLAPRIFVEAATFRRSVVIHPFSGGIAKNWPLENYIELGKQLPVPVEWTAGPEENLAGATRFENLLELARWMRGTEVYVGNDSGISHLAAAIGVRSVVLFGPTNPLVWGPAGEHVAIVRQQPLRELAVMSVLQAIMCR